MAATWDHIQRVDAPMACGLPVGLHPVTRRWFNWLSRFVPRGLHSNLNASFKLYLAMLFPLLSWRLRRVSDSRAITCSVAPLIQVVCPIAPMGTARQTSVWLYTSTLFGDVVPAIWRSVCHVFVGADGKLHKRKDKHGSSWRVGILRERGCRIGGPCARIDINKKRAKSNPNNGIDDQQDSIIW